MKNYWELLILFGSNFIIIIFAIFVILLTNLNAYEIIDGDSLKKDNKLYRLHGIDAPEIDQTCEHDNMQINCGYTSKKFLQELYDQDGFLCMTRGTDIYERYIVSCYSYGYKDVGSLMVREGMAVAYKKYSYKYVEDESYAKENKKGIWDTKFTLPWVWREKNR